MRSPKIIIKQIPLNRIYKVEKAQKVVLPEATQEVSVSEPVIPVYSRYGEKTYTPPESAFWNYKNKSRYGK